MNKHESTMKLLVLIFALTLAFSVRGQNIQSDTIRWNSSGFTDLNSSVVVDNGCEFISYGQDKVDWIQGNGSYVNSFVVNSQTGSWTDITTAGTVTFSISQDQISGQITFTRDGGGTKVSLVLTGSTSPINNSYTISSTDKL